MKFLKKHHIHAFDIFVAFIILMIVGSLIWVRISRKSQWISLRLVLSNDELWWEGAPPQWWYVESLEKGQTSKNSLGETIAEITDVQIFDAGAYRRRAFVDIRVKGSYDTKRQVYLYNYQPLQIGKSLDFTFGKNNVHGLVTYIDTEFQTYTPRIIEVRISAIRPWIATSYTKGLEMKDSTGRQLAKILSVDISPSQAKEVVEYYANAEQHYLSNEFYDVTLQLQVQTYESEHISYFIDRAAIKIGERIWFQFPQTAIREATIIKVIE